MGLSVVEKAKLSVLRRHNRDGQLGMPRYLEWRTFVHIDDGHDKFWKIAINPNSNIVYTNYGVNGTDGINIAKRFDWHFKARRYIASKIVEKTGKGYREIR